MIISSLPVIFIYHSNHVHCMQNTTQCIGYYHIYSYKQLHDILQQVYRSYTGVPSFFERQQYNVMLKI